MKYTDNSGTVYVEKQVGLNTTLEVETSADEDLHKIYKKVEDSLRLRFQPVNFKLQSDGILVIEGSKDSDLGGYLKQLLEREDSIVATYFGGLKDLKFPLIEDSRTYYTDAIIAPARRGERHTGIFGSAEQHTLICGSYVYEAYKDDEGDYVRVAPEDFCFKGSLVHVSHGGMFETIYLGCHRVWDATDRGWNDFISRLPLGVDLFFDAEDRQCIRGLPLAKCHDQIFVIENWGKAQGGWYLKVRTLTNDITFIVHFKYRTDRIDILVWNTPVCSLDYISTELWR